MGGPHTDSVNSNVDGYAAVSHCVRAHREAGASKRASAQREEGEGGTHAHAGAQVRRLVGRAVCEAVRRQALAPVHVPWYVQHSTTCCNSVQQGQAARQQALAPAHVCAPSVIHGVLCRNMLNYFATCCTTASPPACFLYYVERACIVYMSRMRQCLPPTVRPRYPFFSHNRYPYSPLCL